MHFDLKMHLGMGDKVIWGLTGCFTRRSVARNFRQKLNSSGMGVGREVVLRPGRKVGRGPLYTMDEKVEGLRTFSELIT